ncbi:MAG: ATP-dependent DNA ligase [bacterium]|nr:ATP-dependent DNA ligase [bacterium]
MLLAEIVTSSNRVAAEPARNAKVEVLAEYVASLNDTELPVGVSYLSGVVPQGSFGVGYASLRELPKPAARPSLTLGAVDAAFTTMAATAGAGSVETRRSDIEGLFALATADEQKFLMALLLGGLRQGASERLMMDAVAMAFGVPGAAVRRATMFSGDLSEVAVAASKGEEEALAAFGLRLFRPVLPMLAKPAASIEAAMDKLGTAAVERKLDGARIQVHIANEQVAVYTRNLNDVTDRVPELVEAVLTFDVSAAVFDGEAIAVGPSGRPLPFQVMMGRFGSAEATEVELSPFVFDILHLDGKDVLDEPTGDRLAMLDSVVPTQYRIPRIITDDVAAATSFFGETLAAGHEGIMIKSLDTPYEAGRRGAGWLKVKPVHTLDLVVLAVEWGSGRRQGWLSNIHLGARAANGEFVMLGKTFKGMTDEMLRWQTERFLELETHRKGRVVHLRPEQVVEIAFDGVQASSRYPGGVALRFARVKGYRDDKAADEADTIEAVLAILQGP